MIHEAELLSADDGVLTNIELKVLDGVRLDREDALALERTQNFSGLARMADRRKRLLHGDRVTWVANLQVNPTNVCALSCKFCEFGVRREDPTAYALDPVEVAKQAPEGVREVHIVGGLHPHWGQEQYFSYVDAFREHRPGIGIKAFTAVEVEFIARKARKTTRQVLAEMKARGVEMLPGGGAEVLVDRIHKELYAGKIGPDEWLRIHREAHEVGIRSNATLLFGHIERPEERVEHLLRVRELQDETGGFLCFIPLVFQPGNTGLRDRIIPVTERVRQIAIARLVLDNVASIKAYWAMLGLESTIRALQAGADDMDGTIGRERIAHAALAQTPVGLVHDQIEALCREAGVTPVERDHLHRPIKRQYP